jgi:hypothetical protein
LESLAKTLAVFTPDVLAPPARNGGGERKRLPEGRGSEANALSQAVSRLLG